MKTSSLVTRHGLFFALCVAIPLGTGCKAELKADVKTPTLGKKAEAGTDPDDPDAPAGEAAPEQKTPEQALADAVGAESRPADQRARDKDRHPDETLNFFQLNPEMTVLELEPYDTWYTRVIAAVVQEKGKFIATSVDPEIKNKRDPRYGWAGDYRDGIAADGFPAVQVEYIDDSYALGDKGSVDLVISVRNEHGFVAHGLAGKVNRQVFRVLKPGGYYGLVAHRADPKAKNKKTVKKGYLTEASVIARVQKAGFELVAQSEINANPKDTKEYKRGVWALPPTFAAGAKNRSRFEEIGESDRMTLLFRKPGGDPAAAPAETPTAGAGSLAAPEGPPATENPGSLAAPAGDAPAQDKAAEEAPTK